MKPTTTIILLLLLAGCIAFVAWPYVFPQEEQQKSEDKTVFKKLGEINRLTVTANDGGRMTFEKTGGEWKITEPVAAAADPFAVHDIIDRLKGLQFVSENEHGKVGDDITGLDKPAWVLTVADDAGNEYELRIGKAVPLGNGKTYVGEGGRVLVVGVDFASLLSRQLNEYRNMAVLDLEKVEFDEIRVSGREKYELKQIDKQWRLTSPIAGRANAKVVQKLVERLSYILSRGIAADNPTNLAVYGLDVPQLEVTFSVRPKKEPETQESSQQPEPARSYTIIFGSKVQNEVYVKLADGPTVYRINAAIVDEFAPKLDDIRDSRVLEDFTADFVCGVELQLPGGLCAMIKEGGVWLMEKPFAGRAEPMMVETLLDALGKLTAESFQQADSGGMGFDRPQAAVSLKLLGKDEKLTLLIGDKSPSGEMTFVKTASGSTVYVVRTDDLSPVFADAATYWDSTIFKVAGDEKITRLSLFRADGAYELACGEDGAWKMVKPVECDADRASLIDINNRLDRLAATEIVALGTSLPERFDKANDVISIEITVSSEKELDHSDMDAEAAPGLVKITRKCTLKIARIYGSVYGWIDGASPVAVGEFDASLYEALTAELKNRRVIEINLDEVRGFGVTSAGSTLEFTGEGDDWQYSGDTFVKMDPQKIHAFLASLASTAVEKFVSYKSSDAAKFGCDRPELLLEIRFGPNQARQLRVSAKGPKDSGSRYATMDGVEGVFLLSADKVASLAVSLNDFKK